MEIQTKERIRRWLKWAAVGLVAGLLLIQLIPYGHNHDNPPVVAEPAWDSAQTRELAVRACFDCHSNEVTWPWYSNVAPMSWLVQFDVEEGRNHLNFSEWNNPRHADDAARVVRNGAMPPTKYTLIHSDARLTDAEMEALASGLEATLGR